MYTYNADAYTGRPDTFYTKGREIMTHFLTDILHNTRWKNEGLSLVCLLMMYTFTKFQLNIFYPLNL